MDWSRVRWVLDQESDAPKNCDHTLEWIKTVLTEMIFSIDVFTRFPQSYNTVEADKSYTMMTFKKCYGITVEGENTLLESGLG